MRNAAGLAALTGFLLLLGCDREPPGEPSPAPLELSFLADYNIDFGERFELLDESELGGISALLFQPARDAWLALSDVSESPRFYELRIRYGEKRLEVDPTAVFYLKDERDEPLEDGALDPEGLAATPWGTLVVSTEADSLEEPVRQARLLEFDPEGRLLREFEMPPKFRVEGWPPAKGVRHNQGFEGLTFSPDGSRLFVGVENTLLQDGPAAGFDAPGFCRIVELAVEGEDLVPRAEYVYPVGPIVAAPGIEDAEPTGGLVELVALSTTRLLALERVFIRAVSEPTRSLTRARVYAVDLRPATDVSSVAALDARNEWRPVQKELLLDLEDVVPLFSPDYRSLDNFEAMGLGAELSDGGRALLLASDDNFQETQRTAFLLFRLKGVSP